MTWDVDGRFAGFGAAVAFCLGLAAPFGEIADAPAMEAPPPPRAQLAGEDERGPPPLQFQGGNRTALIDFREGEDVKRACGDLAVGVIACADGNKIIIENPCSYVARHSRNLDLYNQDRGAYFMVVKPARWIEWRGQGGLFIRYDGDYVGQVGGADALWDYTVTMCHELAHVNGWPGDHWRLKDDPQTQPVFASKP